MRHRKPVGIFGPPVIVERILLSLTALSVLLLLWQYVCGRRFLLREPPPGEDVHRAVSILKPVGSLSSAIAVCLESWLAVDYPGPVEILIGVAEGDEGLREEIAGLVAKHPSARIVDCPPEGAANPKVAKLIELASHATHGTLVFSDADVAVERSFLREFATAFKSSGADLACCLYRLRGGTSLAQKLECTNNNVDFWSQVTQALSLGPMDFALGAAMIIERPTLERIGGFEAVGGYLADDYQLGHRIHREGGRIHLAPQIVDCLHGEARTGDILARQLRWARTMRACKPLPCFFSILSNPTLWPLLYFGTAPLDWLHATVLAGCLLVRIVIARQLLGLFTGRDRTASAGSALLAPLRDVCHALLWLGAFAGNTVTWTGQRYRIDHHGRLQPR